MSINLTKEQTELLIKEIETNGTATIYGKSDRKMKIIQITKEEREMFLGFGDDQKKAKVEYIKSVLGKRFKEVVKGK